MSQNRKIPNWFVWVMDNGFLNTVLFGTVVVILACTVIYIFDRRLDEIEGHLTYASPNNYESPDLSRLSAEPNSDVDDSKVTVYVPIYSHIYHEGGRALPLESTLSIRNVDISRPLYVQSVRYYGTDGSLVRENVDSLIKLEPLETVEFLVERRDSSGGSGANFIVDWLATEDIEPPMIEAVMIGITGTKGVAFRSTGRVLSSDDLQQ